MLFCAVNLVLLLVQPAAEITTEILPGDSEMGYGRFYLIKLSLQNGVLMSEFSTFFEQLRAVQIFVIKNGSQFAKLFQREMSLSL